MKQIREIRAQAIQEANAWIVPIVSGSDGQDSYSIEITNGFGLRADFEVGSLLLSAGHSFITDDGPSSISRAWKTEVRSVNHKRRSQACRLLKSEPAELIEISINEVLFKYITDGNWRVCQCDHFVEFSVND